MISYKDEDLYSLYGDKERYLNYFLTEKHKNIKVLDYMDDSRDFICPKCNCEEYTEVQEEDMKTYLYCDNCEKLIARYLDHNEFRFNELLKNKIRYC